MLGLIAMKRVLTGLDVLRETSWSQLKGYRLGLLSNQASLDSHLHPAKRVIARLLPGHLKALYAPQHGFGGTEQDNMKETSHTHDPELDLPVFSLYSEVREPTKDMLDPIDLLLIDLQDVGCRVYTFASTMLGCLKAAAQWGKKVVILDRPNPLGGDIVEGNLLQSDLFSFVGPYRLPMRHGLTMAEMARVFNHVFNLKAPLDVVPMKGWERTMRWQGTGLRWLMPSPNMPLAETAQVYPGQVLWEGTNISEGRGTCRPFEIFGAPFLQPEGVVRQLVPEAMNGCALQELTFRPTFHKWQGALCRGFMIHITDPHAFRPFFTSIALLGALLAVHGQEFAWKAPPYEYESDRMPIDLILGDLSLRMQIESGRDLSEIKEEWLETLEDFLEWRTPYLLYP
jgi:uncharacterized protein YbbC (DUF1343 family)